MPIEFRAPEPFSEQVSRGYGAAEQQTRDLPTLASIYEAGARLDAQARQANADRVQQAAANQARNQLAAAGQHNQLAAQGALQANQERTQVGLAQMQLNDRAAEFNAQAQTQANLVRARAEAQAWLNQQDLSQAEALRLQRMQRAVGEVMATDDLTPEEKAALVTQLRTGIDPLRQRQEMSIAKLRERQEQEALRQAQQAAALTSANEATRTQAFASRLYTDVDEETGERTKFFLNSRGDMVPLRPPRESGADAGAKADADARKQYAQAVKDAAAMARRERDATTRDEDGKPQPAHPWLQDDREFENYKDALASKLLGYDPTKPLVKLEEHVARRLGRGQPGGGQPQGRPAPAPPPAAVARTVAGFRQAAEDLHAAEHLSPQERTQGTVAARQAADLIEKSGGDLSGLSQEDLALYQRARELQIALFKLNEERRPKPPGPAPLPRRETGGFFAGGKQ